MDKRKQNELKFGNWERLPNGGRRYWYEVVGRHGRKARYVKEVDAEENPTTFIQQIFDEHGRLIEVHEKYPEDKGHKKMEEA